MKKLGRVLIRVLRFALAAIFLVAASGKFSNTGSLAENFLDWGYPLWFMNIVGVAEGGGALLLLPSRTRRCGVGVLAVVMMGAVATHLLNFASMGIPLLPLALMVLLAVIGLADRDGRNGP